MTGRPPAGNGRALKGEVRQCVDCGFPVTWNGVGWEVRGTGTLADTLAHCPPTPDRGVIGDHRPRRSGIVARFLPGQVMATVGAVELLDSWGATTWRSREMSLIALLERHLIGDWGDVDEHDAAANNQALLEGLRLLSNYYLSEVGEALWVITEADRSVTTFLLPREY